MTETAASDRPVPQVTDQATWQARIDELRVKEKAHTRAGDALAAERRRLPMVEVDPTTKLIGSVDRHLRRSVPVDRLLPDVAHRPARRGAVRGLHLLHDPHQ